MIKNLQSKIYKLLRWSEKYIKTDMVYLAKGGSWLGLGQFISTIAAFLLAIAFANLLPKETYGTYKFIFSIVSILTISTLIRMENSLVRAVARGYEGSIIPVLKTKIKWGLLGSMASLFLAGYYYLSADVTLTISFLMIAVFLPFTDTFSIYSALLQGRKLFNFLTKYNIITQIIIVLPLIGTLFLTDNLFLILLAYFVPKIVVRFIIFKIAIKKFMPNKKEDEQAISFGKHLSLIGLLDILAENLDKILLWHYLGAAQLAVYAFAQTPFIQIRGMIKKIFPLALPKLSQRPIAEIKKTLPVKMIKMFLVIIPLVAVYIILAPWIFKTFFPQYTDSIFYSQLLVLSLLFQPKGLFATTFGAHAQKKKMYILSITTSIVRVMSLLILLPIYGIMGAVAVVLGTLFFDLLIMIWLFRTL